MLSDPELIPFLIHAKQHTYASGAAPTGESRPQSHDLHYRQGRYLYLDTYVGGLDFAGEEAVWVDGRPVWAMNYYGRTLADPVPAGFGEFLKLALMQIPANAPYRGPAEFQQGDFTYRCAWQGSPAFFSGHETIESAGQTIYELDFHGGQIR
jgi:hypothetical protein